MTLQQGLLLLVVGVLALWVLGAHNRLAGLRRAVNEAWSRVDATLRQRDDTLAGLLVALREPLAAEPAALGALAAAQGRAMQVAQALAARPLDPEAARDWAAADVQLSAAATRVLALLQAQPPADAALQALLAGWRGQADELAFARRLFNEAAQRHDDALLQWPTRLLTPLLRARAVGRL